MAKTVLITGGTRGVGQSLVELCLAEGFDVIATGSSSQSISQAQQNYPSVSWMICDFTKFEDIQNMAKQLGQRPIDLVIHNAGVQQARDLFNPSDETLSIEAETQINFNAPIILTRLLFKNVERIGGTWVFVTSGLAIAPKQSSPVYCANKAGLRAFCKSFRGQIKLNNSTLTVCEAILPLVDTDMTQGRGKGKITPQQAAKEIIRGALKGQPEIHIGKIKFVMQIRKWFPNLIENIMLKA